jgi:nitrous oxide reductase accessory protein NosL
MGRTHGIALLLPLAIAIAATSGCGSEKAPSSPVAHGPAAIDDQEDPVCGMLVRNQSAPRGQVRHRDGTSLAFCSLGDMLIHLDAPSRHGETAYIYVEVLRADEDPMKSHPGEHPWAPAAEAFYVIGVKRQSIMGPPILSYADAETAAEVASSHPGAQSFDFAGLQRWWREQS